MRLKALCAGRFVPAGPFRATVLGAFDRALSLVLPDGRLVGLLSPVLPRTPWGIRLASVPHLFREILPQGAPARSEGAVLYFPEHGLNIELGGVTSWLDDTILPPDRMPDLARAVHDVTELLRRQNMYGLSLLYTEGLGLPSMALNTALRRTAATAATNLEAAAREGDAAVALAAARPLLGLGPGLTPSGDDFLVGFLAGLRSLPGRTIKREHFLCQFGNELGKLAATATNEVARTFVTHAGQGHFTESIVSLGRALAHGSGLTFAAQALLSFGASSGADTLVGIIAGWHAWS
jgi:Protein of unknown function (DUF2877)